VEYDILFSEEAESQLKNLDNATVERILKKIMDSSKDPKHFFERLTGREEYKLRMGDWQVIAKIIHSEKKIFVISIGHRKNVYR
jgi:mRNA interferase RelE/StbE